jgi:S-DNA-T family DNA segregation ATPase FtsK/SpoIIIE
LYDGIPHLLAPIITEPEKALRALKWAVDVMNKRYKLLKENKVRNIDEYNQKVDENNKMSRIVIIVDELADLMMS